MAEASLVTPIKYLSLVFAIVFGFLIWTEVPKILTLFGALLVIASSLIIFVRESQLKKQIINPRAWENQVIGIRQKPFCLKKIK